MVEWPTTEIKTLAHYPTQWLGGATLASLAHHSTHYTPDATPEDLADNDVLQSYSYDYYKDGQKSKETFVDKDGQTHTWAWVYDQLSRLISEVHDNADNKQDYTTNYTYDLVGNRLNTEVDKNNDGTIDTETNSTFDVNDRLLSEEKLVDGTKSQRTDYVYNKTEQISKTITNLINSQVETKTTMAYNAQGRLSEITIETFTNGVKSNIVTQEYTYDSSGMKVRQVESIDANADGKIDAESSTFYLLDALNHTGYTQVLEERRVENGVEVKVTTYTIGHDVLAQFDNVNGYLALLSDGHGSTRAVANMAGEIVQEYNYDAYGNAQGFNARQALTSLLYSGEQFNPVSGLQYLRARWYDPGSGRFNRLDPYFGNTSSPLSFHKYAYGHMNPVGNTDPTGKFIAIAYAGYSLAIMYPKVAATIGIIVALQASNALVWYIQHKHFSLLELNLMSLRNTIEHDQKLNSTEVLDVIDSSLNAVRFLISDNDARALITGMAIFAGEKGKLIRDSFLGYTILSMTDLHLALDEYVTVANTIFNKYAPSISIKNDNSTAVLRIPKIVWGLMWFNIEPGRWVGQLNQALKSRGNIPISSIHFAGLISNMKHGLDGIFTIQHSPLK